MLTPSDRLSGHNALGSSWRRSASPSRAILSAYDDATALGHQKLLLAALSVGNGPAERMATAVRHERVLSTVGTVVAALARTDPARSGPVHPVGPPLAAGPEDRRPGRGRCAGHAGPGDEGPEEKPVTEITVRGCPTEGCYARTPRTAPGFISGTFRE